VPSEHTYLGLRFSTSDPSVIPLDTLFAKAAQTLACVRRRCIRLGISTPRLCRTLYRSSRASRLFYDACLWGPPRIAVCALPPLPAPRPAPSRLLPPCMLLVPFGRLAVARSLIIPLRAPPFAEASHPPLCSHYLPSCFPLCLLPCRAARWPLTLGLPWRWHVFLPFPSPWLSPSCGCVATLALPPPLLPRLMLSPCPHCCAAPLRAPPFRLPYPHP